MQRLCTKLNHYKNEENFYLRSNGTLTRWCKDCAKRYEQNKRIAKKLKHIKDKPKRKLTISEKIKEYFLTKVIE